MSLNPSFFGLRSSSMGDPFYWDSQYPYRQSSMCDPLNRDSRYPYRNSSSFNNSLSQARWDSETADFGNTRVVWKETPEAHVFHADLPGVKKEEVKVEVEDGGILQISRRRIKEEETDTWHWEERSSGSFVRRFRLPENAKVDQVKASMENGVLTVTVPKEEVKKPHVKEIEISGQ